MAFAEPAIHHIENIEAAFRVVDGTVEQFAIIDLKFQQNADYGLPATMKLYFPNRHIEYARRVAEAINATLTTELCEDEREQAPASRAVIMDPVAKLASSNIYAPLDSNLRRVKGN